MFFTAYARKITQFVLLLAVTSFLSCDSNAVFKDHEDIDDGMWFVKNEPSFTFEITDISQPYNVYYLVRNSIGYPYYNLFVKRFLLNDKNKVVNEALNELILMDERTGKPMGDGLGDLFDHKIVALKNYRFPKAGKYSFKVRQYMRQDPLPGIMSMGVSVEPAVVKQ
ncbi:gliding motility-associated lipoprotein GldH [Runella defluvii]|uniref:Gliding motility-associated lipoprotein GldH n=1 Tax=Runella defluvii TaxID=370973 RepID=A0A7W5ZID7_9BACT|nr:gliding motility lipoprotein GldH [Runella defluvii]MBB3837205.1 gliding motility-associated lipoprotein GldH [Runella defluvii]